MTGNASKRLDRRDPLNWDALPLRHRLRGQVAQRTSKLCRPARVFDDFLANLFHALLKAYLSQPRKCLFR